MEGGKFNFTYLPSKELQCLRKRSNSDYLMKWCLGGNLHIKFYNFNEKFLPYQKEDFVKSFFTDRNVISTIETLQLKNPVHRVTVQQIPCTVTSMAFFTRISSEESIIAKNGFILQCMEELIDGFYVNDKLRALLLDPAFEKYDLFSSLERQEFIFLLFRHLCLGGGELCQQEIYINPYLDMTKQIYKELISVQRAENQSEIKICSLIIKAVAYDEKDEPICPAKPDGHQNFVYFIIDGFKRQVAVLIHENIHSFLR